MLALGADDWIGKKLPLEQTCPRRRRGNGCVHVTLGCGMPLAKNLGKKGNPPV